MSIVVVLVASVTAVAVYLWPKAPVIYFGTEEVFILDEEGNPIIITAEDRKPEFYNILVFGKDKDGWNTDTIMIFSLDVKNNKYSLLSIPRDTMVNVSRGTKKINAAYAYGGIDNFYKELNDLLGFKPDRYVIVSLAGFEKIIDAMGGVDVDVAQNMKYSDPAQNLYINFQKGMQHMDGKAALEYVRFRSYPDGDIQRVRVQQGFVKAVSNKMLQPGNIVKIPAIIKECFDAIETDMTLNELIWLASKTKNVTDNDQLETVLLPGYPRTYRGLSYYIPTQQDILAAVNSHFNPYTKTISSLNHANFSAMFAQEQAEEEQRAAEEALRLLEEEQLLPEENETLEEVDDDDIVSIPDSTPPSDDTQTEVSEDTINE